MSESKRRVDAELVAIEAALGSLSPMASGIARDRLMFLAGRASVEAGRTRRTRRVLAWLLPCATAASLALAVALAVSPHPNPLPKGEGTVFANPQSLIPNPSRNPAYLGSRELCQLYLEKGIDAFPMPEARGSRGKPMPPYRGSYRDLMREVLNDPAG